VVACVVAAPATAAAVGLGGAKEAERRIALAAEEGMIVEDIVKAACMVHRGVDTERHAEMIRRDTRLFTEVLVGLQSGSAQLGVGPERHGSVIEELRDARALWLPFRDRADAVLTGGPVTREMVTELASRDAVLLDAVDALVASLQTEYGGSVVPLHVLVATRFAVRQETIAQQLAKGACLISAGIEVEAMRAKTGELIGLFETTHAALVEGMPMLGIRAPQDPALAAQLVEVAARWQAMRGHLAPLAGDAVPDAAALDAMSRDTTVLVAALKEAVALYENEL
ncbi:MAG: type IV pili methyl-accepting chemotaxis transducer N-terminal domain-containing protein, partial [Pseudomonadota bacterium]